MYSKSSERLVRSKEYLGVFNSRCQPFESSSFLPPSSTTRSPTPPLTSPSSPCPPLPSSSPPSTSLSDLKFGRKCGGPGKGNGRPWNWKKDIANYKQLIYIQDLKKSSLLNIMAYNFPAATTIPD